MEKDFKKKVLITGAAGFIGFHSALALQKEGHWVIGYDNFSPYYDLNLKKARERLLLDKGIPILCADICNTSKLLEILEKEKISHVLHLAAQAGVRHSLTHPKEYVYSNV
ncbi:MAG: NAD-dependent epimerase/dehydratase family protein, partial [Chlamydiota bacterium]